MERDADAVVESLHDVPAAVMALLDVAAADVA